MKLSTIQPGISAIPPGLSVIRYSLLLLFTISTAWLLPGQEWEATSGPYGASCRSLLQLEDGTLFAGSEFGGLFISHDTARTWSQVQEPGIPNFERFSFYTLLNTGPDQIMAATSSKVVFSNDGGSNWEELENGLDDTNFQVMKQDAEGTIYAGTSHGNIYRTSNNGQEWEHINASFSLKWIRGLAFDSAQAVYAATEEGLFATAKDTENWSDVSGDLAGQYFTAIEINAQDVWVAGTLGMGTRYSLDEGMTWEPIGIIYGTTYQIEIAPSGGFIAAGSGPVFTSPDGIVWQEFAPSQSRCVHFDVLQMPDGSLFTASINFGVQSFDPGSEEGWQQHHSGMDATRIISLASHQDEVLYACSHAWVYRSYNGGETWEWLSENGLSGQLNVIRTNSSGRLFACGSTGLAFSDDEGESWDVDFESFNSDWPAEICFKNDMIFLVTYSEAFFSPDNGETWENLNIGLTQGMITIACSPAGTLFIGTVDNGIYRSEDNGASWNVISTGLENVKDIDHFLFFGNTIMLGARDGVYSSSNDGWSWEKTGDPGLYRINTLVMDENMQIYASASGGVKWSSDLGETWSPLQSGFANSSVAELDLVSTGALYAGTQGDGVYRLNMLPSSVLDPSKQNSPMYIEMSAAPNPFTEQTVLMIELKEATDLSYEIYTLSGTLVSSKHLGHVPAGSQKITLAGHAFSGNPGQSTVFLVRVISDRDIAMETLVRLARSH